MIARGVSDVSKKFTAKFDGFLYITIYKQVTGTCTLFVDDTFAS